MKNPEKRLVPLTAYVLPDVAAKVKEIADIQHKTVAEISRQWILAAVEKESRNISIERAA
jgi:hypothetical protein